MLIVVDVNTKDYQGRAEVPTHFAPDRRIELKPLITNTTDANEKEQELNVLAKYVELYWD